jgi:hypothetical protein
MATRFLVFLLLFIGCARQVPHVSPIIPQKTYPQLIDEYISCSGHGKIDSRGFFQGALSFTFISQNDSSFFQFKDPLGRKALLMWLTPVNVTAWNLIENKQYTYDQILEFFPFLQVVEPTDITKFLWGVQPDYEKLEGVDSKVSSEIVLQFGKEELDTVPNALVTASFKDNQLNQSVYIRIKGRSFQHHEINLQKVWKLIHS